MAQQFANNTGCGGRGGGRGGGYQDRGEEEEVIRDTTRGTTIDIRPRNNTGEEGTAAERDTIKFGAV